MLGTIHSGEPGGRREEGRGKGVFWYIDLVESKDCICEQKRPIRVKRDLAQVLVL